MSPTKVALFTDSYLPAVDGVVTSVLQTKRALESMGHEVIVLAPGFPGLRSDGNVIFVRAKELRSYPGYRIAYLPTSEMRILRRERPDIVHAHGVAFMGLKGMWAARELEVPLVTTYHTNVQDALRYYAPVRLKVHVLERLALRYLRSFLHHCSGVIAPAAAVVRELKSFAPHIRRMAVIPTGVDVQRFHPSVDGAGVREAWDLNGSEVVLHVGRVAREKNLETLLRAMPLLARDRPDAVLLVVGTGPALAGYRRLVNRLGLRDRVIFAGFVPDGHLPGYYAAADCLAIASKFETQGLVVLEAMASGKPVAGAAYRAIPDFVRKGENGFLFPPDDVPACAAAIEATLNARASLRDAARRTAEGYSIEKCSERLVGFYRELLT